MLEGLEMVQENGVEWSSRTANLEDFFFPYYPPYFYSILNLKK